MAPQNLKKRIITLGVLLTILLPVSLILIGSLNSSNKRDFSRNLTLSDENILENLELSGLPPIDYESLNAQWYEPNINMLIIAPNPEFASIMEPLKDWKNEKGVRTVILDNSSFSQYAGSDKAEQIRNMIKDYYEKEKIEWVLLAGDAEESLIPIRKVYNPDVVKVDGASEAVGSSTYKPTDFYYADLNGTWDDNENGRYGESSAYAGEDEIEWIPEVYVGRFPASNAAELEIMVNKTLEYETNMNLAGEWMKRMLLAGGVSDDYDYYDDELGKTVEVKEDEARLTQYIWQNYVHPDLDFKHLYETTDDFNPDPTNYRALTRSNFNDEINNIGYSTVIFAGHGSPTQFISGQTGHDTGVTEIYTAGDAESSSNDGAPSLFYGDACTTASFDYDDNNIGEGLIKQDNAGAIGYIGALRVTWYWTDDTYLEKLNRGNAKLFWKAFFEERKFQQGKALYDSKVDYMESDYFQNEASIILEWERKNILTYNLLGDPEVDIYTDQPVNISNPFPEKIFEGQLLSFTVTNRMGQAVPYARIHLTNKGGAYRTAYADDDGEVSFRLPAEANTTFETLITGHNVIPTSFNFTTSSDLLNPAIGNYDGGHIKGTVSQNLCFDVTSHDAESGIERVFTLISDNDFNDYEIFEFFNNYTDSEEEFHCQMNKLDPGSYKYLFVARDYANNLGVYYNNDFTVFVETPLTSYILIGSLVMSIAVFGGAVIVNSSQKEKYLRHVAYNEPPRPEMFKQGPDTTEKSPKKPLKP